MENVNSPTRWNELNQVVLAFPIGLYAQITSLEVCIPIFHGSIQRILNIIENLRTLYLLKIDDGSIFQVFDF